ncbi:zinc finger, CCHC-type containing protein, partial [Tanacetum coccineum]
LLIVFTLIWDLLQPTIKEDYFDAAAMKHMASNFAKLDKFEGVDFKRWQKKMHFLLSSMSVVYAMTTPIPEDGGDDETVGQIRKRAKWDNDDYVYRGLILNDMSDSLFDIYQNVKSFKELWDSLEAKYMAEDASSKKFLEELTLVEFGSHLRIKESLTAQDSDKPKGNNVAGPQLNIVNDNIVSAFMSTSKLNDSILWQARLGHVYFKRMQDMSKNGLIPTFDIDTEKCKTCMLTKITKKPFQDVKRETKVLELIYSDLCDLHATPSLGNKKYFVTFNDDAFRTELRVLGAVVRLPDPRLKFLGKRGIECIFVAYAEHSKGFRFYVIEHNDSVSINSIIESRDAIFNENRFSLVPRPSQRSLVNGTEDIGCSVVLEEVTEEVVQQPEPELRKIKRNVLFRMESKGYRVKLCERGIECIFVGYAEHSKAFRFYVIEPNDSVLINSIIESRDDIFDENRFSSVLDKSDGLVYETKTLVCSVCPEEVSLNRGTRDEVSDQHSYCFNIEDDPKTFDEAMKSHDVAFWKEAIHDEMDSIIGNNTWVLADLPPAFLNGDLDEEQTPKQWHQKFDEVVLSNGYLLNQADKCLYRKFDETGKGVIICLYVDDMLIFVTDQVQVDLTKEFLSLRVLKYLKKTMDYRLTYTGYPSVLEGYTDASWISNTEDNSSTSGWVFLLGVCQFSWLAKEANFLLIPLR